MDFKQKFKKNKINNEQPRKRSNFAENFPLGRNETF